MEAGPSLLEAGGMEEAGAMAVEEGVKEASF